MGRGEPHRATRLPLLILWHARVADGPSRRAVWRGRVWEQPIETDRLSSSSGIAPVTAVTLRDERVVEVDASRRTRVLTDGHWFDIEATDPPGEVSALIGARSLAQGECVLVDRDGGVFELQGSRWVRTVTAPGGTIR